MTGRSARTKGAAFERQVAALLREHGFPGAARGLGQARSGGEVADVDGTDYWIECKARKAIDVHGAYAQGVKACGGKRPVLAVTKRDRETILATMALEDWLRLAGGFDATSPELEEQSRAEARARDAREKELLARCAELEASLQTAKLEAHLMVRRMNALRRYHARISAREAPTASAPATAAHAK